MDTIDQWAVPTQHRLPVDAIHVVAPVVGGHETAILVEHLTPLVTRGDASTQSREINGNVGGVLGIHLVIAGHDADLVLVTHDESFPVTGDGEGVDGLDDPLDAPGGEPVMDEGVGGSLSGDPGTGGSELTTPIGLLDPHDTVLDGSPAAIPTRGNREGHQTLLETITVQFAGDRGCMIRVTSGVGEGLRLGVLHLADPPSFGNRSER